MSRRVSNRRAGIAAILCLGALLGHARPTPGIPPGLDQIRYLNRIGRFAEAESAARTLLSETERRAGSESLETAGVLDELAVALRRGGKRGEPEAREVCERALRIKERTVGRSDARYAASLHNLGLLLYMRGDLDTATTHLERALEIREETLGGNHPDVAWSLLAIGVVEAARANFASARAALERAVEIQRTALAIGDTERAYGLEALGSLEYEVGACAKAIPLLEEAIALWKKSEVPNRPMLGTCYHNLGCVHSEIGDTERALQTFRKALRFREESLGRDDPTWPRPSQVSAMSCPRRAISPVRGHVLSERFESGSGHSAWITREPPGHG